MEIEDDSDCYYDYLILVDGSGEGSPDKDRGQRPGRPCIPEKGRRWRREFVTIIELVLKLDLKFQQIHR